MVTRRRRAALRARLRRAGDDGFSLIEAVVALSILAGVAAAFTLTTNLTLQVTRDVRLRQQATHLLERELEIARNQFKHADTIGQAAVVASGTATNANPLPGGTVGQPLDIDGRTFTVVRTNTVQVNGEGQSACDGGALVDYLTIAVGVRVTWSDSGRSKHVDGQTLLTPVKGVEGDVGYLAAKLTNAAGGSTGFVPVTATGPGGTQVRSTAGDGCAVFLFDDPGTYTLSVDQPGYVNAEGIQAVGKTAALELGKLKVLPFSYEQAAEVTVAYETAPGHVLPSPLPGITAFNSGLAAPGELHAAASGSAAVLSGLWPFPDGYSIWAGTCDQSNPAMNSAGHPRPTSVPLGPGADGTASAYLAPFVIRAVDSGGAPLAGVDLEARPLDSTGCEGADAVMALGATGADGTLAASLPAGQWEIWPEAGFYCWILAPDGSCPIPTGELLVTDPAGGVPIGVVTLPDVVVSP
jgi:type II secretory pathway pseudopilin PulG